MLRSTSFLSCIQVRHLTQRYALVIGVSHYPGSPLSNAVADAGRATTALRQRGFRTTLIEDAGAQTMDAAINSFGADVVGADIALIYLAGHAVERHGAGYFLPSDFPFPLSPSKAMQFGIRLNVLVRAARSAKSGIVVLDACRNWPADHDEQLRISSDIDRLVEEERTWRNVLLAYSTSASTAASDGVDGVGSLFCQAFCRYILNHKLNIDECFRMIAQEVTEKSRLRQQPWTYSSLQRSIGFTDLPRFEPLQRHVLPHDPESPSVWCVPDHSNRGILVGNDGERVWHVDLAGYSKVPFAGSAKLVGAADFQNQLFLAGSGGEIFLAGNRRAPARRLHVESSFGFVVPPNRLGLTHFGGRAATIFRVVGNRPTKIARIDTEFDVYCCVYLTNDLLWLGGDRGQIVAIDLKPRKPSQRRIANLRHPLNAMVVSRDATSVFCADQAGRLIELDATGNVRKTLLEGRRPQTAAGVRATLLNIASDELIRDFIFNPAALGSDYRKIMDEEIGYSSLFS